MATIESAEQWQKEKERADNLYRLADSLPLEKAEAEGLWPQYRQLQRDLQAFKIKQRRRWLRWWPF